MGRRGVVVGKVDGKLGATVFLDHPPDGFAFGEVAGSVGFLADEVGIDCFTCAGINVIEHEQVAQIVTVHLLAVGCESFEIHGIVIAIAAGETILLVEQDLAAGIVGVGRVPARHAALFAQLERQICRVIFGMAVQGDVESDQEFPCADDRGASLRIEFRRTVIRRPGWIFQFLSQTFVFTFSDHRQIPAPLCFCGGFV